MKYIRQVDMGAHVVDASGEASWVPPHFVEEPLVDYWLSPAGAGRHGLALQCEAAPDGAIFDPGGMVMQGEARVTVVANGQTLVAYLRSVESLVPLLQRECHWRSGVGPPHCLIRGAYAHTLLTLETARAAAELFAREAEQRAAEADALWAARDRVLAHAGVHDMMAARNPVEALKQEARRAAAEGVDRVE